MNEWLDSVQLGSALLKGSVLLLVLPLCAQLLRKASAASLYRVWFVGLCMALLAAVASLIAPICNLDVPIAQVPISARADRNVAQAPSTQLAAPSRQRPVHDLGSPLPITQRATDSSLMPPPISDNSQPTGVEPERKPQAESSDSTRTRAIEAASITSWKQTFRNYSQLMLNWWPAIWFLGVAAILLQMLLQHSSVFRAIRLCEKLKDPALSQLCTQLSQRLAVSTPQLLVQAESVTPFIAGLWKPQIVLPAESSTWSHQKATFVMLHELAHIKRRDLLAQLISRVVVAVYWFNPLSWWGYAQMMRLRELACDDWVLQQEKEPGSYAEALLDVASRYRSQEQALVIGMSGKLDIARRIHSALDSTRTRTPFSRRTSRCVTGLALMLCLVLGAIQLRSRAVEPQDGTSKASPAQAQTGPTGDSKTDEAVDEQARSMLVRILDEDSQPLAGVDVYVTGIDYERRGGSGNLPRIHYPTDTSGEARIKFREGTLSLQLWPGKPGYVPQYVQLNEKQLTLPSEYTFYFEKGTRLAGKITDHSGTPIAGASVQVKTEGKVLLNERALQSSPSARCTGWLASGVQAAKTNAQGEWEIRSAPSAERNPKLEFELLVDHPEFAGDLEWGDYQRKQGITTEQLRGGTAMLVLDRGAVLRGTITGPDGNPVTQGLVIWVENPYYATGVNEVPIQSDGSFRLPNLTPGKYPITVLAPGFAPDQREVEISQGAPACDFQLQPGNPIRLEIVDAKGEPIPHAFVGFGSDGWRGTSAIYNNDHSNVPASGIPRQADENGVFTWSWAPVDGVQYTISKSGFDSKSITLVAKPEPHRIVLTSPLAISGNVVDAASGKPIHAFKAIPVKAFRPDFYSTDFQESRVALGENGQYEIQINTRGETTDRYRVRIEADGYRTAFGMKSLAAGDPPLVEDFHLEPVAPLTAQVVTTAGTPVNKFHVAIGTPTTSPSFDFDRPETLFGQAFEVESKNTFEIAASFEPQRIRVFSDEGFAELLVQPDQKEIGRVVLQPYAQVSGRLMQGEAPIGTEGIYFYPLVQRGLKEARFQDGFFTQTDPDGYFRFERLPPLAGSLRAYLGPWRESPLTSAESIPLELKPGDHKQVALGDRAALVTGRVVASGRSNEEFSKQWSLNWLVSRDHGVNLPADASPLSIPTDAGPIEIAWLKHTDFSAWLATKPNHFVKLSEEGSFQIHGVSAGEYDLVIQLFEQPAGCLVEAVGTEVVPIAVSAADVHAGALDIGSVEVACRAGPRPGSDMRAFQFVNSAGEVVYVDNLSGRYILFHFWASWCQPCLAAMPELEADMDGLQDAAFTAVGFNVDADKNRGKALALDLGLDWAQNYLGEDSDFARQLAISSVPAYYLIGPDGVLVGSSSEWQEMRRLLHEQLHR